MRVELLPGLSNVVRFPVERCAKPTLKLLRAIAPDVREVLAVAESFGMEAPAHDLRERADAETAEHILNHSAGSGGFLDGLLRPVLQVAIGACRAAHDASLDAVDAQQALLQAKMAGGFWVDPLRERAERLTAEAAVRFVEAYAHVEEAEGVARAISFARRGVPWVPRDREAEADELIAMFEACRAG